jgi:hypothetical protein
VHPSINLATLATEHLLRTAVVAAEIALLAFLTQTYSPAPTNHLILHTHEDFLWDSRLVIVLHIVLRHNSGVSDSLFAQEVYGIGSWIARQYGSKTTPIFEYMKIMAHKNRN